MATVYPIQLDPGSAIPGASAFPALSKIAGTNYPMYVSAFDASSDEWLYWCFRMVQYGSGNISIDIDWYADNASSGNVVWQAKIAAITPNTDTQDIETKAFATLNYVQDTHLGTTGQRLHRCTITLSNLDSVANGDWVCLAIGRDADGSNATDDMANDAIFVLATLSWSDS